MADTHRPESLPVDEVLRMPTHKITLKARGSTTDRRAAMRAAAVWLMDSPADPSTDTQHRGGAEGTESGAVDRLEGVTAEQRVATADAAVLDAAGETAVLQPTAPPRSLLQVMLRTRLTNRDKEDVCGVSGVGKGGNAVALPVLPDVYASSSTQSALLSVKDEYRNRFAVNITVECRRGIVEGYGTFLRICLTGPWRADVAVRRALAMPLGCTCDADADAPAAVQEWKRRTPIHPNIPRLGICAAMEYITDTVCILRDKTVDTATVLPNSTDKVWKSTIRDAAVAKACQEGLTSVVYPRDAVVLLHPLRWCAEEWASVNGRRDRPEADGDALGEEAANDTASLPTEWVRMGCIPQLAVVQRLKSRVGALVLILARVQTDNATQAVLVKSLLKNRARTKTCVFVRQLGTLHTAMMELQALHTSGCTCLAGTLYDPRRTAPTSVAYHDWLRSLLDATDPHRGTPLIDQLRERLLLPPQQQQRQLNKWQVGAIAAVLYAVHPQWDGGMAAQCTQTRAPRSPELLLIEGPPGTGKTQTIASLTLTVLQHLRREAAGQPRILVCAPSNCAVDEALLRVVRLCQEASAGAGRCAVSGELVRVGVRDKVDAEVLKQNPPVFLDDIVQQRRDARAAAAGGQQAGEVAGRAGSADWDAKERAAVTEEERAAVTAAAAVVFSTLGSLHRALRHLRGSRFDLVIVDEASQGTEPAVLQALTLARGKCVLVGDSRQLQPTVLSRVASRCGLQRSLLVRLLTCGHPSFMLRTQYRMHPDIVAFPNAQFYGSRLLTDRSVRLRSRVAPGTVPGNAAATTVAQRLGRCPRFVFVDVKDATMQQRRGHSLFNQREAAAVVNCMRQLRTFLRMTVQEMAAHVGIITFYAAQKDTIVSLLTREERKSDLQVATVDSFQGKEKCIILLSCVRTRRPSRSARSERDALRVQQDNAGEDGDDAAAVREERAAHVPADHIGLGFLADWRRLNVALTRAQDLCVCFGSGETIRTVGLAAAASAVPPPALTTLESSAAEVEEQVKAGARDPLVLYSMLEHAETHDATASAPDVEDTAALRAASADSVEVVDDAQRATRARSAAVTYHNSLHLLRELMMRGDVAVAQEGRGGAVMGRAALWWRAAVLGHRMHVPSTPTVKNSSFFMFSLWGWTGQWPQRHIA